MSATLLGEIIERRQSTARVLTSPQGNTRTAREYLRYFRVRTTSKLDGPATVGGATGLPELYDSYETDTESDDTASVISIEPREEDKCIWTVEVRYSTETGDEAKSADNPLSRPTEISFSSQKYTRPLVRAWGTGKITTINVEGEEQLYSTSALTTAVINSAGEAFDPPIEMDDSRPTLTFTRNEGGFDTLLPATYQDAVNSDSFFGYNPLTVKCSRISAVSTFESGFSYWKVTYEFEINFNTWRFMPLDQGTRYKDANGKVQNAFDRNGAPVSKPILLNGAGRPLVELNAVETGSKTTLSAGIDIGQTTFNVTSRTPFGPTPFIVKIDDEEMIVASTSGGISDSFIGVIRGVNGTAASVHTNGSTVQQQPVYLSYQGYREVPFAPLVLP